MIARSELGGDALANWSQRSPAEVDAEREAVRQEQYDAFVKSIGAASELQGNSAAQPPGPAQGAAQRSSDNWGGSEIGSSDGDTGLLERRYYQPFAPPVIATPPG